MLRRILVVATLSLSVGLIAPPSANAFIHEIIGAACRSGGQEVIPPGQVRGGQSFVRALQATGVIESIDMSVAGQVTVNFDPDKPASKFVSAGFDLTIVDGFGPGVDLILSPLIVPDEEFAAHANCFNLNA
jgi:hypothetical protein